MKFDLAQFRNDPDKLKEGAWVPLGPGARWKVRRWGNPEFQSLWSSVVRPRLEAIKVGAATTEEVNALTAQCVARGILTDWDGVFLDDVEVPFSVSVAEDQLTKFPELLDKAIRDAKNADHFRAERIQKDKKILGED